MVLIIDNYDSFTYNLYQLIRREDDDVQVFRSDKISIDQIENMKPDHIILSPGPGYPQQAGVFTEVVRCFKKRIPILGICLGHQAIMAESGVSIIKAKNICHGKIDEIEHNGRGIFRNIKKNIKATRYHSLVAKRDEIPAEFTISALSSDGEVMAVEHKRYNCVGIQFHPESVASECGGELIKNFLNRKSGSHLTEILHKAMKSPLDAEEAECIMNSITDGELDDAHMASLMTVYNYREIDSGELAAFAKVLREKSLKFPLPAKGEIRLDTCGTGGASVKTFNVSTTASFIIAALGIKVVKHGNRAVTSKSGSMDLLEELGVDITSSPDKSYDMYVKTGISFLYAPYYHSSMKYASAVRKSLSFKSFFNLIGPLSNPASANRHIMGVYDEKYLETFCGALKKLGVERAMVFTSRDGLDEISVCDNTCVCELSCGKLIKYEISPHDFGLGDYETGCLKGGGVERNAQITIEILKGDTGNGNMARIDMAAVNAGAGIYICGKSNSLQEGYSMAKEIIMSGKAYEKLTEVVNFEGVEYGSGY